MEINLRSLPKKIRSMNKEELIAYINKKLKMKYDFLNKLELEEIQYFLIHLKKYGNELLAASFLAGAIIF